MNCPSCQADNEASATACSRCGTGFGQALTSYVITVDLRPGTVFHSRYEILSPLGKGGMGTVYKAHDRTLDETVAIKVLRPDFAQDPRMADRFKSEIKLARKVRHKNVCTIHDYGEEQGLLFISMELVEGVDLKHILREKGAIPAEQAYDVGIQVAEGLQAVHDAGIVHRDLKTPNIMLDPQGVARLMDFGVAKRLGEGTLTATGQIVGTPEYMSPEQAQGHPVDYRSDIYALGIVLFEIFTGRVPFRGETPISTILKHLNEPPPLDGPAAARIPPRVKAVLQKALAKEPTQRYATSRELAEALRDARSPSRRQQPIATEVLEAPTVLAPPRRAPPKAPAPRRPQRLLWAAGGLAVVVLGLLLGLPLVWEGWPWSARPSPSPDAEASPGPGGSVQPVTPDTVAPFRSPSVLIADSSGSSPAPAAAVPATQPAAPPAAEVRAKAAPPPSPAAASSPRPSPRATPAPALALPAAPPNTVPASTATPVAAPAELTGSLLVAVKPWAEVTVDGELKGSTPLNAISLLAGAHQVRIKHPGYEILERQVLIRAGQQERLVVDLTTHGVRKNR
ncbi:MAG TPA: protein kinase [Vicinamibacteria bacterium]|nr:protein kinase [Vicinamibacteria bacterium]